jgi:hypothetical protein
MTFAEGLTTQRKSGHQICKFRYARPEQSDGALISSGRPTDEA